jgi:hypothetical protein
MYNLVRFLTKGVIFIVVLKYLLDEIVYITQKPFYPNFSLLLTIYFPSSVFERGQILFLLFKSSV